MSQVWCNANMNHYNLAVTTYGAFWKKKQQQTNPKYCRSGIVKVVVPPHPAATNHTAVLAQTAAAAVAVHSYTR
jgi:hypothetical protein